MGVEEAPAAQPVQLTMFDTMGPMPDTSEVTSNDNLEDTPEVNVRTVEEGADLFGEQEYKESTTTGPLVVTPEQRAEGVVPRSQEEDRVDLWDYRNNYFNRSEQQRRYLRLVSSYLTVDLHHQSLLQLLFLQLFQFY